MSWNPVWETVYQSRPWGQYPGEDVIRFVAGRFFGAPDRACVRLLEVGCGSGANLWFMAREGFSAHGVDGSPTAARLATERLDRECPDWRAHGGQVQVADMAHLPYPSGAADSGFDAVLDVVAGCYSSVEQARRNYAELARVTRVGGHLFVRTFAQGCWGEGTGASTGPDMWDCAEGPLAGLGPTRFTAREQIDGLLQGWQVTYLSLSQHSNADGGQALLHWVIHAIRLP
jgi:SAM-dependent methyltransferase